MEGQKRFVQVLDYHKDCRSVPRLNFILVLSEDKISLEDESFIADSYDFFS